MSFKKLTCFQKYDVRGEIGVNIDKSIVYRIARSMAQHFSAKKIVVGYDARETSKDFAKSAIQGF